MVYTISDKVLDPKEMTKKFKRVKDKEDEEDEVNPNEQRRIWKNVLILGFAFMLHFTAFWGASNLQSSVNSDESLGTFTLAAIYGSLLLSNILLPSVVIKWFGCKWAVAVSFLAYVPFIGSQFYPRFYTMIPAGLAVGLGGGPLWCAKCTYLSIVSDAYSKIAGVASDLIVTRFFGVFFMFYQLSQVWGNLISSAVLSWDIGDSAPEMQNVTSNLNVTESVIYEEICGANFYPSTSAASNPNLAPPSSFKINTISAIYIACILGAFLIVALGMDSPKRYSKERKSKQTKKITGLKLLLVTLKHIKNPYQVLILPITMFIGAEQAFLAADFTIAYVSCGWNISKIGFVMICFGVCNAVAAILGGGIVKKTGRSPVIAFALMLHVMLLITLLRWTPSPEYPFVFFIIAGLWGIADAMWLVQINSYYGILFPGKEEAAYSNFRLWESTGSVITYAYSPYLGTNIKIFLLLGLLLIGVIGYTIVEYLYQKNNSSASDEQSKGKFSIIKNVRKSEVPL